jgi:hypothetical protein
MIGGDPDRDLVKRMLKETGQEIDILAGRSFGSGGRRTVDIDSGGLPLADLPDLQRGSMEANHAVYEVADPVNEQMTTVLQMAPTKPAPHAIPIADALFAAGQFIYDLSGEGGLSRDYVLWWLGQIEPEAQKDLMRRVMDPDFRFNVPVMGVEYGGWWFQVTRRLIWVTPETRDEGRLLEPLFDTDEITKQRIAPLCAAEAVLIAARMTSQPIDWAFSTRIWTEDVNRRTDRPWRMLAKAIHGHGIPVVTIDRASSRFEIACQVVLKAYWHGYIGTNEPGLARAVALAFPRQVARVRSQIKAPDDEAAAATLLEGLIYPGFDPARGAEANRRYVTRKASIAVMEHHKREWPERYPWTRVGITERRFYKLLPMFASKVNGRYEYDHDAVVERMKASIDAKGRERSLRDATMDVLRDHGFTDIAARKWLQRHEPAEAISAWPRERRLASSCRRS